MVEVFDHATVFNKNTPHKDLAITLKNNGHKVIMADYQPTCELLVIDFANKIKNRLPSDILLHSLKLQEAFENALSKITPSFAKLATTRICF